MRIEYKTGNILRCSERVIVHGCNAQGKYGSGVAKAISDMYPRARQAYLAAYGAGGLRLGQLVDSQDDSGATPRIFSAITQVYYGRVPGVVYVNYAAVRSVFWALNAMVSPGESVAMPAIGAGTGGGDWAVLVGIIEAASVTYQPVVYLLDGKHPGSGSRA